MMGMPTSEDAECICYLLTLALVLDDSRFSYLISLVSRVGLREGLGELGVLRSDSDY